jgi:hypothetical protein
VTELTTDREDEPAEKSIEIAQTSENLIENGRRGHTAKSLLLQTYRVIAKDNRPAGGLVRRVRKFHPACQQVMLAGPVFASFLQDN